MFTFLLPNKSARTGRVTPRVEALEDRQLLTVSVVPEAIPVSPPINVSPGNVLKLTGDGANDTIVINDNGAGTITGSATGFGALNFSNVVQIIVRTRGGRDGVVYNLTANLQRFHAQLVSVDLGPGDDGGFAGKFQPARGFTANLANAAGVGSDLSDDTALTLLANGGAGKDRLRVLADKGVDVPGRSRLQMALNGDGNDDDVRVFYQGLLSGQLDLEANGGGGRDAVQATLDLAFGSRGSVGSQFKPAVVRGGPGNDNLTSPALKFVVTQDATLPLAQVFAEIRGDGGSDSGQHSANVNPFTLETLVP